MESICKRLAAICVAVITAVRPAVTKLAFSLNS